jgi:hypothetical protein
MPYYLPGMLKANGQPFLHMQMIFYDAFEIEYLRYRECESSCEKGASDQVPFVEM